MTDLRFGEFEVDVAAELLRRDGETVHLEPRIFHLLVYLLEQRDRLVTKQDLNENVWRGAFVTDNAVDRAVARLRKALGDDVHAPRFIETVPTRGYRFVAPVEVDGLRSHAPASTMPAAPSQVEPPVPAVVAANPADPTPIASARAARAQLRRTLRLVVLGLCTVPILGVVLIALRSPDPPVAASAPAEPDRVVARQLTSSDAYEFAPSFSPDGASLAYTSNRSGKTAVWVRSLTPGGRDRELTETAGARYAAWSPDGRFIAYDTYDGLWIVPPTGGSPRQVVEVGSAAKWSADSTTLVYQTSGEGLDIISWAARSRSTIWSVGLDGAPARQITRPDEPPGGHGHPNFSPDGRRVAFVTSPLGLPGELWTVSADGRDLRGVLTGCQCRDPVFSRDGASLYYDDFVDSQHGLWQVAAAGGTPSRLYEAPLRFLSLAPDGRRMAASRHHLESDLWSIAVSPETGVPTSEAGPISVGEVDRNRFPVCSPDGERLVVQVSRAGNLRELWMVPTAGGAAETLVTGSLDGLAAWSDDSRQVFFVNGSELQRLDIATRRVDTVLRTDLEWQTPAVAPGGRGVAFSLAEAGGVSNVWTLDVAGRARQITHEPADVNYPTWSPDGRWLAVELDRPGRTPLGYVGLDGGKVVELTHDAAEECFTGGWSPDGDKILYTRRLAESPTEHWDIWWVSRSTGERRQLTQRPLHPAREFVRYPTWSASGDRVFFELAQSQADLWLFELPGRP